MSWPHRCADTNPQVTHNGNFTFDRQPPSIQRPVVSQRLAVGPRLLDALETCRLGHLAERLDDVDDWRRVLSGGEQQRVAFARALLQKPRWLFMDEATSALDGETEDALLRLLRERLPETSVISVGHRAALARYHRRRLRLEGPKAQFLEELPVPAG